MKKLLLLSIFITTVIGCKTATEKDYLPESTGKINSLAVVIDNDLWKGSVGDEIRKYFAGPVEGLPNEEPIFSIHQMPPSVFTDMTRSSRNVLLVQKDSVAGATVRDDMFAKPQKLGVIRGNTDDDLIKAIQEFAPKIIQQFKENEVAENQRRIRISTNKETALEEKLKVKLSMPSVYNIVKQENNFFWIERQIQNGTSNIILYEMPLNSIPEDSTRVETIVKMRDSIGERYIPGREEGMYMITEKGFAPSVYDAKISDRIAIESKGTWEVKDFLMAGPFLNYIVEDKPNNRLLVMEGFVFAPSVNKRDYMFELESILKGVEFNE